MIYDVIIKNGKIIDGTGNPGYFGDIGIKERKISKITDIIDPSKEEKIIDAKGLIVSSGFIVAHSYN
jgi:N-acyl-D-aspartate/D-glutamate deacylase